MHAEEMLGLLPERVTVPSFRVLTATVPLLSSGSVRRLFKSTSKRLETAATSRLQVLLPHPPLCFLL